MHLSDQQIKRYQQGSLAPAELLVVGDHLDRCAACREHASSSEDARRAFVALSTDLQAAADREPAHLAPEEMASYLDEELGDVDRSIADSHLELCSECRAEMLGLRALKSQLSAFPLEERAPIAAPTRWSRFLAFSPSVARWLPLAAAAVAALLIGALIVIPLRNQLTGLRLQVSQLEQSNGVLQEKVSSLSDRQDQLLESHALNLNAVPIVTLRDGESVITLDKDGGLAGLGSAPPTYEELVKTALRAQRVKPPPLLADLLGKRGVLMGGSGGREAFFQLGPVGTVVETDRPTFRWRPLSGATSYVVTVYNSASKQAINSPQLSTTEWTPSDPLARGGVYVWEVTATRDGNAVTVPVPPAAQAKFKVLEYSKLRELNHAREVYRNSHLILGVLYAEAGLLDEAERQFEALVAANPDSLTARRLLDSLKAHKQ